VPDTQLRATRTRKGRVDLTSTQASELARLYIERPDLTTAQLAARFGVARTSVAAIVARHGVELRRCRPGVSHSERAQIIELYRDMSLRVEEIARRVGRDPSTIHRVIRRLLPKSDMRGQRRFPDQPRRYSYRDDLFTEPLSDEELWLFGLLLADGTTDGRYRLNLRLAMCDRDAVETARRIAGSTAPITVLPQRDPSPSGSRGQHLARWGLDSQDVVRRLHGLGMRRAKSYRSDTAVPAHVASSADFWRGLIDGDGTVSWNSRRTTGGKIHRRPYVQVLGSKALLDQWCEFVVATIGGAKPSVRPKPGTRVLHISTLIAARAWRMLAVLYDTPGPALKRKAWAAREMLSTYHPPQRSHGHDGRFIWLRTDST
jgi:DNA-binding MarR family transcriptional regulator